MSRDKFLEDVAELQRRLGRDNAAKEQLEASLKAAQQRIEDLNEQIANLQASRFGTDSEARRNLEEAKQAKARLEDSQRESDDLRNRLNKAIEDLNILRNQLAADSEDAKQKERDAALSRRRLENELEDLRKRLLERGSEDAEIERRIREELEAQMLKAIKENREALERDRDAVLAKQRKDFDERVYYVLSMLLNMKVSKFEAGSC
jgi:chromosome segregation ATPase